MENTKEFEIKQMAYDMTGVALENLNQPRN